MVKQTMCSAYPAAFKSLLSAIVLLLFTLKAFGQIEKNYVPAPVLDTIPREVVTFLKQKLERDKSRITESKPQVNAFLKSLYEKRYEYLTKTINDDYFIADTTFTPYLQAILDKIYKANPQLPKETQVFALRSPVPNAMSFGDGTLGLTLSLLARLKSEDQVAFILCHEMAHYHSEHAVIDMEELARLNYDKDLKRKIDAIKRDSYGQYTKLSAIFKGMGLSLSRHSRIHEFEADSLGLEYFKATAYNPYAAVEVMAILDSVSLPLHPQPIDFKKHFDFKDYPFKNSWLAYEKSTTWHVSNDPDSLRTHPDCQNRILALERQLSRASLSNDTSTHWGGQRFQDIRIKSEFEQVFSDFHFKSYGRALYEALLLTDQYPDNVFLQAMIGQCLYKLYAYQKNHASGKVLELPDPRFPENYDRFLTFAHRLRLMELASLAYQYMATRPEGSYADEEFLYALWMCSTLEVSKIDPQKVKEAYDEYFPAGKYKKKMTTRP